MFIKTTYFYAIPESFSKGKVFLDDNETHHLVNVLRAKEGDEFLVTNGAGELFRCRLSKWYKKGAVAEIVEKKENIPSPTIDICLGMGLIKSKLMELALDWAIQLGISRFVPIITDYTQKEFLQKGKKYSRFEKIAISAIKQSLRTHLPEIYPVFKLPKFLQQYSENFDGILFADYNGVPTPPKRMIQDGCSLLILVGCEGGFSTAEKAELSEYGAVPISLGNSRLRTETAAVTAVAKLLIWSGNV